MASTDRPTIRVQGTEDLLALIPFILGFQPDASLVLVAMDRGGVPFTARMSLPTTPESSAALLAALGVVTAKLTARAGVSVVLVGYGPADPVQKAVDTATDAMQHAGIPIREALRVAEGRFWRLDGSGPVDGTAIEPTASPAAAAAVYAGLVALPDRDAVADTLAPVAGPARDRMVAATAMACEFLVELLEAARRHHRIRGVRRRPGRGAAHPAWAGGAESGPHLPHPGTGQLPVRAAGRRRPRRRPDRAAGPAVAAERSPGGNGSPMGMQTPPSARRWSSVIR